MTGEPGRDFGSSRTDSTRSSTVELRTHLRSVRRFYKSVIVVVLAVVALAAIYTIRADKTYESSLSFFASSASDDSSSALAADEFAQRRINSYVGVVQSERMAQTVLQDTGLPLSTGAISKMIGASTDPDTVLLNVTVVDTSPERSLAIAQSIADNLDSTVADLDNRSSAKAPRNSVELSVISGPSVLPDPVSPRTKLNIAIGLLLGLGLGVAQAILRQQFDPTVRSGADLADVSGQPTIGELKRNKRNQGNPILMANAQQSRNAESFRQLRTNLRFMDAARPVQVIVITSSVAGEGKTGVAANLALAFAESGRRVLLIDGDLRRPRLETYLDLEGSVGLTDVLIGELSVDDVVQKWGKHGLHVLASGLIPPNPAELLGSSAMEKLVEDARATYEIVIIDTPPLLPVTDAAITASLADGAIVIVKHGSTKIDHLLYSIDALHSVDARVLGTVLTMAPSTRRDDQPLYYQESGRAGSTNAGRGAKHAVVSTEVETAVDIDGDELGDPEVDDAMERGDS